MKKIALIILLVCIGFMSCKNNDDYARFDTLSKYGEIYFSGQQVAVWAGVEVSDRESATYSWECDGGSFSGPQHVFRNTWIAPYEKGEYTITCTVSCNGKSDRRSTKMIVSEYFFENFGVASTQFVSTNLATVPVTTGEARLTGNKTGNTRGEYKKTFTDPKLLNPFTFKTDIGYRNQYRDAATSTWITLVFNRPVRTDGTKIVEYIKGVNLGFWMKAGPTSDNFSLEFVTYNSQLSTSTTHTIIKGRLDKFAFIDGATDAGEKKGLRTITISVDANFDLVVTSDGEEVLRQHELKTWMNDRSMTDKLNLKSVAFNVHDKCQVFVDNIKVSLD